MCETPHRLLDHFPQRCQIDGSTEFEIDVTAGQKLGITVVKIKPFIGRAVDLRIEVVK